MKKEYSIVIIADHGNCEKNENSDGTPNTAHTINPVPIILVERKKKILVVSSKRCTYNLEIMELKAT